jgi:hypothetical protein
VAGYLAPCGACFHAALEVRWEAACEWKAAGGGGSSGSGSAGADPTGGAPDLSGWLASSIPVLLAVLRPATPARVPGDVPAEGGDVPAPAPTEGPGAPLSSSMSGAAPAEGGSATVVPQFEDSPGQRLRAAVLEMLSRLPQVVDRRIVPSLS